MRRYLFLFLMYGVWAQADSLYHYSVNLTRIKTDRVSVTLTPPAITVTEIEYMFPAMVPGTYEIYNFGRFISGFSAKGKNGKTINISKTDINTYKLSPANEIESISYEVDDTFDKTDLPGTKEKIIFEPGGTNFEADKNFSINTHGMFGYFAGMLRLGIEIEFNKPPRFYPSTGLTDMIVAAEKDKIKATDYYILADSPIMYCIPDTTTILVENTRVLVSVYSPNRQMTSGFVSRTLKELLLAQAKYLGGELPVDKYAFLFYFTEKPTLSGANGALEHSYSSFYVLQEFDSLILEQSIRDIAAHEFFHIVTPLTIHSEEIGDFDFNKPVMSAHLWMYEGMTEYAAHHAQVKAGIISVTDFINTMMRKYSASVEQYNDTMSFTWMSKNVLNEKIHPQYGNVYEKGAVISMCLDILLRDLSGGRYGTQELMKDLSAKYGKHTSFKDEQLFKDIEALTFPEVGTFLAAHVGGKTPLPMEDIMGRVGLRFKSNDTVREFSLGNPDLGYNQERKSLVVIETDDLDAIGKKLGYKKRDELVSLNEMPVKPESIKETIAAFYQNIKDGDTVEIVINRPRKVGGRYRRMTLKAPAERTVTVRENQISVMPQLSDKQRTTLRSWIGL